MKISFALSSFLLALGSANAQHHTTANDPVISALLAQVDALSAKVASLEAKAKSPNTTIFQGKKHVRRRLNRVAVDDLEDIPEDVLSMPRIADATEDVEPQTGIILSILLAKVAKLEAIHKCVGYDTNEDVCSFGSSNVNHVVIESNLDIKLLAHDDIMINASDDINIIAASSIDIDATGIGSGSGDIDIFAASDSDGSLDMVGYSVSIDAMDSVDISASGDNMGANGNINLDADPGDVNIQGNPVMTASAPAANEAADTSSEDSPDDAEASSED